MTYEITREHVWVGAIPDRPDALAEKLRMLSDAGLDLELILARREMPGRALLFISPLRSIEEILAVEEVGFSQDDCVRTLRIIDLEYMNYFNTNILGKSGIKPFFSYIVRKRGQLHVAFDTCFSTL